MPQPAQKRRSARIPVPSPDYRLAALDNEILLYHPTRTRMLHLNASASVVWQLCDGRRTIADITTLLQEAFPGDPEGVGRDVEAALGELEAEDAVRFA